jgi:hypothetical protein
MEAVGLVEFTAITHLLPTVVPLEWLDLVGVLIRIGRR